MQPFDLDHIFTYHPPEPDDLRRYAAIRKAAKEFARIIVANTPPSADQSDAVRKIREAVMTANAAIALKGRLHLDPNEELLTSIQPTGDPDLGSISLLGESIEVRRMITWFLSVYEDPVESCPHDSAEGGYQFIYGGPYTAEDELWSAFSDADEWHIERAAELLEQLGTTEWSKIPTEEMTR